MGKGAKLTPADLEPQVEKEKAGPAITPVSTTGATTSTNIPNTQSGTAGTTVVTVVVSDQQPPIPQQQTGEPQSNSQVSQPARNPGTVIKKVGERSILEAYILAFPLGFFGAHWFYLGNAQRGVVYLFTLGLFGVGWLVDLVRMPFLVQEVNRQPMIDVAKAEEKSLIDAYILWLPLGILGAHHYYLGRYGWAVAYTFTIGFFGIGWLIDAFLMPKYVNNVNRELKEKYKKDGVRQKNLLTSYGVGLPLGFLGAHHYYLERPYFGLIYSLTLGLLGCGWIVDWFRMKVLVERTNKHLRCGDPGLAYLDDAYLMLFPFGFLGLHHFYLRRYGWGTLYFFTLGMFGVGWIVDFVRLPGYVRSHNDEVKRAFQVAMDQQAQSIRGAATGSSTSQQEVHGNASSNGLTEAGYTNGGYEGQILQPPSYDSIFGEETEQNSINNQTEHVQAESLPPKSAFDAFV